MDDNNYFDFLSPRQPIFWPTASRKEFLIDLDRGALSDELSYDLCSDHSAIIVTYGWQKPTSKALTNK